MLSLTSRATKLLIVLRTLVNDPLPLPFFILTVPGLEHATIRDNIIFGSSYGFDEMRYQAVIDACALVRDLEVFDAGDMTGMRS
jgi:hypothetical protein